MLFVFIRSSIFSGFLLLCTGHFVLGQSDVEKRKEKLVQLAVVKEIKSAVLNETRILNIYLPAEYSKDSAKKYSIIYLLDGSANEDFIHITGIVQFLSMIGQLPESIVVGISNIDRKRDFTFPTSIQKDKEDFPTTGGSAHFIKFLETELLPFIQKEYSCKDSGTIIGQSLGGLLLTEILLKKPALFGKYIIVSPSLWWDNESLLQQAPSLITPGSLQGRSVFIAVGKEGAVMEKDAKELASILKKNSTVPVNIHFSYLPAETHLSILHNAVYRGFQVLYPLNH